MRGHVGLLFPGNSSHYSRLAFASRPNVLSELTTTVLCVKLLFARAQQSMSDHYDYNYGSTNWPISRNFVIEFLVLKVQ